MKYAEMTRAQKKETNELFAAWLNEYTDKVIKRALLKRDEILENEVAMMMLKELYNRESEERKEFQMHIEWLMESYENWAEFPTRNNCITHAKSYRDVLYDMFIKEA